MQTSVRMTLQAPAQRGGEIFGAGARQFEAAPGYSHGGRQPIPLLWETGSRGLCTSSAVGVRPIVEYTFKMQELSRR